MVPTATAPDAKRTIVSVPGRFREIAARHAGRIAISTAAVQWTYAELDRRSDAIAARILERGPDAPEPVALLMEHGALLIAAILGVLKAGKIYVALDSADPMARLQAVLGDAGARLLLVDGSNAALGRLLNGGGMELIEVDNVAPSSSAFSNEVSSDAGAWLIYTGGSTGVPKAVWQNHAGVVHQSDVYGELIGVTPDDRFSLLTSCSLAASASAIFGALLNGATLCPFPVRSQGVERLARWLGRQRVTVYHSVPTVFRHVMKWADSSASFETVRLVRLGGESVLRADVEACRRSCPPGCVLMHAFSSTETGLVSAMMIDRETSWGGERIPVGHPVRDVDVLLLDSDGQPVADGSEGRMVIRGPHLSQGYWRRPDASAEVFRADAQNPGLRLFFTGDVGRWLPDGALEHLGRADQQVKIRGRRVDLAEVEAALRGTDLFSEAAAAAPEDGTGERRLVAYIVPRGKTQISSQECRRALRALLPEHMIPGDFVTLDRLPQTAGGKVDRLSLPIPQKADAAGQGPMPRDGIEEKLARIWRSVLAVPTVARTDDFFDLGGTSLLSAQVLARIEETFNVVLSPSVLTEHGTIEALAVVLAERSIVRSASPLIALRSSGTARPFFLVHNGKGDVSTYAQLARRLPERPIYGFQSSGLSGESWPMMSIPEMARRYVREMMAVDPTGPYFLGGSCMGGMVAFEMAQQLRAAGKPIALLALLDSNQPIPDWRRNLPVLARNVLRIARWFLIRGVGLGRGGRWLPAYRRFVANMNGLARTTYRPAFYSGTITAIFTADTKFARGDGRKRINRYASEVRRITISGGRAGLFMPPAVDELARQLQLVLETAEKEAGL